MTPEQLQTIRVFIASSNELLPERKELAVLLAGLNESLNQSHINFLPVEWEFLSSSWSVGRKQDEYNEKLKSCQICIVMFWTRKGWFTKEELDTAYNQLCPEDQSMKLFVFFKDITEEDRQTKKMTKKAVKLIESFRDSLYDTYGNWASSFSHIDSLKAEVYRNLIIFLNENFLGVHLPTFHEGRIDFGGKASINLQNVPFIRDNGGYSSLCESIETTKDLLSALRPEDVRYSKYAQQLRDLINSREKMEPELWKTALEISKLKASRCSDRLKRAIEQFEQGNNKEAQAILKEEEIAQDVRDNTDLIETGCGLVEKGRQGLQTNLDEYLLKIQLLTNEMSDGWIREVKSVLKKCFEINKEYLKEKKYAELLSRCDLFYSLIGDYKQALKYGKESLEIRKNFFGENHPDVAASYNNVGNTYYFLGDHKNALKYLQKSLEIKKSLFGENHPDVAGSYNNVGVAYGYLGDHKKALEYQLKSLEILKSIYGENHPDVATSYNNVGNTYVELGDHKKALDYQLLSLKIRKDFFGENHPDVAASYNNVGIAYGYLGDHKKALECQLKSLEILKSIFDENHPSVAAAYNNAGNTYGYLEDYKKALEYLLKSLEIKKSVFGENHSDVAGSYNNVGIAYGYLGDHKKALECQLKSLEILKSIFDENHPSVAAAYNNAGNTYGYLGDHKKALDYHLMSLKIRKVFFGENHPDVAVSYDNVGVAYGYLGDHKKEKEYKKRAKRTWDILDKDA